MEEKDENGEVCGAVENTQDRPIRQRRQNPRYFNEDLVNLINGEEVEPLVSEFDIPILQYT